MVQINRRGQLDPQSAIQNAPLTSQLRTLVHVDSPWPRCSLMPLWRHSSLVAKLGTIDARDECRSNEGVSDTT